MGKLPKGWKSEGGKEHTKQLPGKAHEAVITLGEGLDFGAKHPGGSHDKVKMAKETSAPRGKAMSQAHQMITKNGK